MIQMLSEHFSLDELIATSHRNFDNTPDEAAIERLRYTARVLEHIRLILGTPVIVLSGYRSTLVNQAVGGSTNSQHMRGEAADIIAPKFGTALQVVRAIEASDVRFDQLIYEGSWVHISAVDYRKPRGEILTWRRGQGYTAGIVA